MKQLLDASKSCLSDIQLNSWNERIVSWQAQMLRSFGLRVSTSPACPACRNPCPHWHRGSYSGLHCPQGCPALKSRFQGQGHRRQKGLQPQLQALEIWRRGRDLNSRYRFKPVYSLSRRAPSAGSDTSPWGRGLAGKGRHPSRTKKNVWLVLESLSR